MCGMDGPVRRLTFSESDTHDAELMLGREWLVTNGLGGYASGTVSGVPTRRYHGLLVAALPAPLGRVMMLNRLAERVRLPDGTTGRLGGSERIGELSVPAPGTLGEFPPEAGLPVWTYEIGRALLEKRVFLPHRQNTVHVTYRLLGGAGTVRMTVRPAFNIRPHDAPVSQPPGGPYTLTVVGDRYE